MSEENRKAENSVELKDGEAEQVVAGNGYGGGNDMEYVNGYYCPTCKACQIETWYKQVKFGMEMWARCQRGHQWIAYRRSVR